MRINLFCLFAILSFTKSISQDYELRITPFIESKIIYNDSTYDEGLLRLASSVFELRFKNKESKKERKIDHKIVDKIITNPGTEKVRTFRYLNHNYTKFKIFVELLYSDVISIYVGSTDSDDLFYSDFNRQTLPEMLAQTRYERNTGIITSNKTSSTIELPNGQTLDVPRRYAYYNNFNLNFNSSPTVRYYLLKQGTSVLYKVEKNKRFLKKSLEIFDGCPELIEDFKQNRITLGELPTFIEYYKITCL